MPATKERARIVEPGVDQHSLAISLDQETVVAPECEVSVHMLESGICFEEWLAYSLVVNAMTALERA
jgi:hypothetical protein